MRTVECMLMKEKKWLEKVLAVVEKRLISVPQGNIRVLKKRGKTEYYYRDRENGVKERYLHKDEVELARKIIQRDYDMRIKKYASMRIKAINNFLKIYHETSLRKLYEKTHSYRRETIEAVILSDEEYVKRWQEVEYRGKNFDEDALEIMTERGERVRSKSEKIIADKLYAMGVPYRYEYPLVLNGNLKIYPDFTILKMPEREVVYLEHFGMVDEEEYAENVLLKLSTYEKNGIYPGVNLFATYETSKRTLNTRTLDATIKNLMSEKISTI